MGNVSQNFLVLSPIELYFGYGPEPKKPEKAVGSP